jgi:hypothetical protein
VINARLFVTRCAVFAVACAAAMLAAAQAGPGGLTNAQLQGLRRLNLPVIAPSPVPTGFHVAKAEPLPGGRAYRIVYVNKDGASITFEVGQLAGEQTPVPTAAPKHGFLQRVFGGASKIVRPPSPSSTGSSGTSNEAEGQATSAIVADSALIGPVRFTPAGECLRGTADSSKGQLRGVQVRVSGCNFDDPDTLVRTYQHARRF